MPLSLSRRRQGARRAPFFSLTALSQTARVAVFEVARVVFRIVESLLLSSKALTGSKAGRKTHIITRTKKRQKSVSGSRVKQRQKKRRQGSESESVKGGSWSVDLGARPLLCVPALRPFHANTHASRTLINARHHTSHASVGAAKRSRSNVNVRLQFWSTSRHTPTSASAFS